MSRGCSSGQDPDEDSASMELTVYFREETENYKNNKREKKHMIFNALKKPERSVRARRGGRSALQMRPLSWALVWKERALTADRRQDRACLSNNSNGKARCEREDGIGREGQRGVGVAGAAT